MGLEIDDVPHVLDLARRQCLASSLLRALLKAELESTKIRSSSATRFSPWRTLLLISVLNQKCRIRAHQAAAEKTGRPYSVLLENLFQGIIAPVTVVKRHNQWLWWEYGCARSFCRIGSRPGL